MSSEALLAVMGGVCITCLFLEKKLAWMMHISGVCLIIMVALALSSSGLIPHEHAIYDAFTGPVLPLAIVLLIFGLQLKHITRLPKEFLILCLFGAIATLAGGLAAGLIGAPFLGENAWKLAAQLTASYIGGGENAVAIKEIVGVPQDLFVAAFAVDNLLTSLWMVITIMVATTPPPEEQFSIKADHPISIEKQELSIMSVLFTATLALAVWWCAKMLNLIFGVLHPLLYVTAIALGIAQIKWLQPWLKGSYLLGTLLLAPFFFSIGAISNLSQIFELHWVVIAMPAVVVAVHGILIFTVAWIFDFSRLETALASQLLIGGPATAVALAQAKNWQAGVPMGIIMGVAGYAVGNYAGWLVFQLSSVH